MMFRFCPKCRTMTWELAPLTQLFYCPACGWTNLPRDELYGLTENHTANYLVLRDRGRAAVDEYLKGMTDSNRSETLDG